VPVQVAEKPDLHPAWGGEIPDAQWAIYDRALGELNDSGIRYALGGAFGLAVYIDHLRNTKDLDLYVMRRDRGDVIEILTRCGLADYYDRLPYQRHWIYRSVAGDVIVDVIWEMANRRAAVDAAWLTRGSLIDLRGRVLRVLPPEELLWSKLYVMQRERCDWPDIINLIHATGPDLDWDRLIRRLGDDEPLLAAVLSVFGWVCPARALELPTGLWRRLGISRPSPGPCRAALFDSRPWFQPDLVDERERKEE